MDKSEKDFITNHVGETLVINKYDDTPYYERDKPREDLGYTKPDNAKIFPKHRLSKSANAPSPLLIWHMEESKKRASGLMNEIDINEIKAAAKGVKNNWFKIFEENKPIFESMVDKNEFDWNKLMELKNG